MLSKLNIIREGLSGYSISDGETTINITASFGVSIIEENQTLEESIKKANTGLYRSKENGRNQVNVA